MDFPALVSRLEDDLVNENHNGVFEYCVRNTKFTRPEFGGGQKRGSSKRIKLGLFLRTSNGLSVAEKNIGILSTSKLKSINPLAINKDRILQLFIESREYRRRMITSKDTCDSALSEFLRFLDCPYLLIEEFEWIMAFYSENVRCSDFCHFWDNVVVPATLALALQNKPKIVEKNNDLDLFVMLANSTTVGDLPMEVRSELAIMLLPFLVPSPANSKCQLKTLDQLILVFKDIPMPTIQKTLAERTSGKRQPVLVKVINSPNNGEFFIALDGKLISTFVGDATTALSMLFCTFYVFWVKYPGPLNPFFRLVEHAMGMKRGLAQTPAMRRFIKKLLLSTPSASANPSTPTTVGSLSTTPQQTACHTRISTARASAAVVQQPQSHASSSQPARSDMMPRTTVGNEITPISYSQPDRNRGALPLAITPGSQTASLPKRRRVRDVSSQQAQTPVLERRHVPPQRKRAQVSNDENSDPTPFKKRISGTPASPNVVGNRGSLSSLNTEPNGTHIRDQSRRHLKSTNRKPSSVHTHVKDGSRPERTKKPSVRFHTEGQAHPRPNLTKKSSVRTAMNKKSRRNRILDSDSDDETDKEHCNDEGDAGSTQDIYDNDIAGGYYGVSGEEECRGGEFRDDDCDSRDDNSVGEIQNDDVASGGDIDGGSGDESEDGSGDESEEGSGGESEEGSGGESEEGSGGESEEGSGGESEEGKTENSGGETDCGSGDETDGHDEETDRVRSTDAVKNYYANAGGEVLYAKKSTSCSSQEYNM